MDFTSFRRPAGRPAFVAVAFAAVLLGASAGGASAASVAELAYYAGADRTQVLEAGARKEGKLLLYTGVTGTVTDDFRKKYPWLTVEMAQGDAPAHVRRVGEEYAAGRYLVDSVGTSNGGLYLLKEMGHLQPFAVPSMADYRKDAIEPGGHWMLAFESYVSLGFNTGMVPSAEAPRTLDDLLDPKWRGKIGFARTTLPNWIGGVFKERGDKAEAYLRRLAEQKVQIYSVSGRAISNLVVSGEVAMTPAAFSSHIYESRKQGAKVDWRALDGVYANVSSVSLAKHAPHPHAALLYIDYVTSREGQLQHQALGYDSGRADLVNPEQPAKRYYLAEEADYPKNYERWEAVGRQVFGAATPTAK